MKNVLIFINFSPLFHHQPSIQTICVEVSFINCICTQEEFLLLKTLGRHLLFHFTTAIRKHIYFEHLPLDGVTILIFAYSAFKDR